MSALTSITKKLLKIKQRCLKSIGSAIENFFAKKMQQYYEREMGIYHSTAKKGKYNKTHMKKDR